jgi:hypothetical protein
LFASTIDRTGQSFRPSERIIRCPSCNKPAEGEAPRIPIGFKSKVDKLAAPKTAMTHSDFKTSILENDVVVVHVAEGHIYRFPILSNGCIACTER